MRVNQGLDKVAKAEKGVSSGGYMLQSWMSIKKCWVTTSQAAEDLTYTTKYHMLRNRTSVLHWLEFSGCMVGGDSIKIRVREGT